MPSSGAATAAMLAWRKAMPALAVLTSCTMISSNTAKMICRQRPKRLKAPISKAANPIRAAAVASKGVAKRLCAS